MEGWICPRCGKVNAPWVPECDCILRTVIQYDDSTTLTAAPRRNDTTYIELTYIELPEEMKL